MIMEEIHSTRLSMPSWDVPGSSASWARGRRPADVTSATERAVEQYQRMPVAVALAVQLQRAHVDVAVKARRHPCAR